MLELYHRWLLKFSNVFLPTWHCSEWQARYQEISHYLVRGMFGTQWTQVMRQDIRVFSVPGIRSRATFPARLYHQWRHTWCLKWLETRSFVQSRSRKQRRQHHKSASLALCDGNPPVTGGFPSQRASNASSVSMSWHLHIIGFHSWNPIRSNIPSCMIVYHDHITNTK